MTTPELPKEPVGSGAETLLEFPCDFPLKIMGLAQDNLAQEVLAVIHKFAPDYDGKNMEMRASSSGSERTSKKGRGAPRACQRAPHW